MVEVVELANTKMWNVHVYGAVEETVLDIENGTKFSQVLELVNLHGNADHARIPTQYTVERNLDFYIPYVGQEVMFIADDLRYYPLDEVLSMSASDLTKIPGVGESIAKKMYAYFQNNEVTSFQQLKNVEGIGEKKYLMMMGGQ